MARKNQQEPQDDPTTKVIISLKTSLLKRIDARVAEMDDMDRSKYFKMLARRYLEGIAQLALLPEATANAAGK
jgi:metal-responsive CopG/Arc/MetJ family transcriptional regulator